MQKYTLPNINDFAALAHDTTALDVADAYYNTPLTPDIATSRQLLLLLGTTVIITFRWVWLQAHAIISD